MDWLMNNPLADMYGPHFLLLYAGVIALTVIACRVTTRRLDWTAKMPLPPVPSEPDPHAIAYLRGGENEVTRSVIFALVQKGLLRLTEQGGSHQIERVSETQAQRRHLSPIERRTCDWFSIPQKTSDVYRAGGLASHLKPFCAAYEQDLQRNGFLTGHDTREQARLVAVAGALFILGLGAYKLLVAVAEGRYNVGFLIILGAVGILIIFKTCKLPRVSERGRAYIERLQLAFERLRERPLALRPQTAEGGAEAASFGAYDPSLLLLVGVFGVGALAGTPFDYYQQSFRRAAVADNGVSAGGSGCGASCGSSCGSSDGGSSCGSSCGGGCGGGCGG